MNTRAVSLTVAYGHCFRFSPSQMSWSRFSAMHWPKLYDIDWLSCAIQLIDSCWSRRGWDRKSMKSCSATVEWSLLFMGFCGRALEKLNCMETEGLRHLFLVLLDEIQPVCPEYPTNSIKVGTERKNEWIWIRICPISARTATRSCVLSMGKWQGRCSLGQLHRGKSIFKSKMIDGWVKRMRMKWLTSLRIQLQGFESRKSLRIFFEDWVN